MVLERRLYKLALLLIALLIRHFHLNKNHSLYLTRHHGVMDCFDNKINRLLREYPR